jgi:hypothetical protein
MTAHKRLATRHREPAVAFALTARDLDILRAVHRCRYLKTSQIQRLVFPDCRTVQSARRRLKYLYHNGYLGRVAPLLVFGKGGGETAYYLDRPGAELLAGEGDPSLAVARAGRVQHRFLEHALDLAEFRVQLERALLAHPVVTLQRFTADFELKAHTEAAIGKKRYQLYDDVVHPTNRQRYIVYPDALIVLQGKDAFADFRRLFFLEIDRGSEGLHVIRDKVIGYNLYRRLDVYKKFGPFDRFRVLLQTSSPRRAAHLRTALTDLEGADLVWLTDVFQVREQTLLAAPIWTDSAGVARTLLKAPDANAIPSPMSPHSR